MVGAEHVRASVHVEYDLSTSENTDEIYDPKTTATLTQQKSDETAGGGGPAGIPGTASNVPGAAPPTRPHVSCRQPVFALGERDLRGQQERAPHHAAAGTDASELPPRC